jgi:hypothetical protein
MQNVLTNIARHIHETNSEGCALARQTLAKSEKGRRQLRKWGYVVKVPAKVIDFDAAVAGDAHDALVEVDVAGVDLSGVKAPDIVVELGE